MSTEREADFDSMIAFALSRHKRELAELAKKHPTDGQAATRVARGLLAHFKQCGFELQRVKPPAVAPSTTLPEYSPIDPRSPL
ncbi:MAG: hypothetical protein GC184_14550 [Rhizobiales bacterium]|nr:hypothetical protein [Hyphomicrobiales bacterium]